MKLLDITLYIKSTGIKKFSYHIDYIFLHDKILYCAFTIQTVIYDFHFQCLVALCKSSHNGRDELKYLKKIPYF